MISLSDDELAIVMDAARPLPPRDRDAFLVDIARELAKQTEIGPGAVHRLAREVQRRHYDVPDLRGSMGKYD